MRTAVIFVSIHHGNTERVAKEIANALEAKLFRVDEANAESLSGFDLLGFGSGIYYSKHHKSLLRLIHMLPPMENKKAFIFSTAGVNDRLVEENLTKNHKAIRRVLADKGFDIIDDFSCCGFMTWGYYRLLGGRNKGRPNQDDLSRARSFAVSLKRKVQTISNSFPLLIRFSGQCQHGPIARSAKIFMCVNRTSPLAEKRKRKKGFQMNHFHFGGGQSFISDPKARFLSTHSVSVLEL